MVVIRSDILRKPAKLPRALFDPYSQAKARAYERQLGATLMPWGVRHWKKTFDQFGGDPLPYGLNEINRKVLGTLANFFTIRNYRSPSPNWYRYLSGSVTPGNKKHAERTRHVLFYRSA